ncbi:hypothetical protein [Streptomyces sp. NRRL F-5123]|uniref:hypothetical protein n=1 Tax=Streptomyces sp. NRRL F-5123 TaxID=1463856 RepID=UPI00131D507F|nr:hypothetical protein [Streptomyces sp. NRRL F-5123]
MASFTGTGCLVVDVTGAAVGGEAGWEAQPLPLVTGVGSTDAADVVLAGREVRLGYFEHRVAEALYGAAERPVRWSRQVSGRIGGTHVFAVEIVRMPSEFGDGGGLAVLHIRFGTDPLAELVGLTDLSASEHGSSNREAIEALLPVGTHVAKGFRRCWTLVHLTRSEGPWPEVMPAAYVAWGARDQWLWLLASATSVARFPPDPEGHAESFRGRVRFSADWQALVLRDGAAFLGTTADPGDRGSFHRLARSHVHSIYLDAFLLGRLQAKALGDLAERVASIRAHRLDPSAIAALERRLIDLRGVLGTDHVTVRGKGNELLAAYREQHRLTESRARVVDDLAVCTRFVEASTARAVNAALGIVTVLGVPFSLVYGGTAVAVGSSTGAFLWATGISVLLAGAALALIPPLRGMLRALRGSPRARPRTESP